LISLQLGSTFNFWKSFHIHFLIWPLQQSCEVGRASIIIPIWKMGKMKYNVLEWRALSEVTHSQSGPEESPPHSSLALQTFLETRSDYNQGHINFPLLITFSINTDFFFLALNLFYSQRVICRLAAAEGSQITLDLTDQNLHFKIPRLFLSVSKIEKWCHRSQACMFVHADIYVHV
jgi:hypothetical protein